MTVTPGQLDRFAEFYHQLAHMLQAGMPLPKAIKTLRDASGSASFRKPLSRALYYLNQGESLSTALAATGRWLPGFDSALLGAGEQSGRLDECCLILSDYYRERSQLAREVLQDLGWPLLTLFVAFVVFPPSALVRVVTEGDVRGFLVPKLIQLAIVAGVLLVLFYLGQGRRAEWWRAFLELAFHRVPILGKARQAVALSRTTLALSALLNAGVNVVSAWELATDASGSPRLRRAVARARRDIEGGATPGEAIAATRAFPETFVSMYCTGEVSGQLDQQLEYLLKTYRHQAHRLLKTLALWLPRIIYLIILFLVGFSVVNFWLGYYGNILSSF